jgi:hypothetical protein
MFNLIVTLPVVPRSFAVHAGHCHLVIILPLVLVPRSFAVHACTLSPDNKLWFPDLLPSTLYTVCVRYVVSGFEGPCSGPAINFTTAADQYT